MNGNVNSGLPGSSEERKIGFAKSELWHSKCRELGVIKLVESIHYEIYREYETVFLKIKSSDKIVPIGDFYGDVEKVIISPTERYCIMVGCGVIIYQLKAPYAPYEYGKNTNQWKEWYRDGSMWITDVVLQNDTLTMQMETGNEKKISLKTIF